MAEPVYLHELTRTLLTSLTRQTTSRIAEQIDHFFAARTKEAEMVVRKDLLALLQRDSDDKANYMAETVAGTMVKSIWEKVADGTGEDSVQRFEIPGGWL